jgi:hypothetical protein
VHLAKQSQFAYEDDSSENLIKLLNKYDNTHKIFKQFLETTFLISRDRPGFRALLPPLGQIPDIAMKQFKLPFHYTLAIIRRGFPELYSMTTEEFAQQTDLFKGIFLAHFKEKKEDLDMIREEQQRLTESDPELAQQLADELAQNEAEN